MTNRVRECQCADWRGTAEHPNKQRQHQMNLFVSRLDEQQRRWYVALETKKVGYGGDTLLAQITGLDVETIRRGRRVGGSPHRPGSASRRWTARR